MCWFKKTIQIKTCTPKSCLFFLSIKGVYCTIPFIVHSFPEKKKNNNHFPTHLPSFAMQSFQRHNNLLKAKNVFFLDGAKSRLSYDYDTLSHDQLLHLPPSPFSTEI